MCGVVGVISNKALDPAGFDVALQVLHHRGPDSVGRWFSADRRWALGHTRLSIIGLDNGEQPISDTGRDLHLIVNGEFYGYREIRQQLRDQGHQFATDSDSEIALHLYKRDGMSMLRHLRGEFAAVIADHRNNAMIGIRDRFGIKPLFYAVHEGNVLFASEIKALVALGVPVRWNHTALLEDAFLFRPNERTLFTGIHSVPAGHYAIAQDGQVRIYSYWDADFPTRHELAKDRRSDADVVDGFREVLNDAVRERLVADVEVACYLSGGIDSCSVLGLAQQQMDRPIRAYTLSFEDALYDESEIAREQAELVGSSYQQIPVSSRQLVDAYSDAVWHAETLFSNGHGVAKFLLSRAVRDAGIKVVFTGEGADEILGGYPQFRRDVLLYNNEDQDPESVRKLLAQLHESNKATRGFMTIEADPAAELETVRRRLGWVPSWVETFADVGKRVTTLFRDEFVNGVHNTDPYEMPLSRLSLDHGVRDRDPLNQALYLWQKIMLPNYVLTLLGDRMEMAHSIEGRVPFLDHKVAEFSAAIPVHMKINGMREKHVLREAARDVIIERVYNREKHPFTTPPAKQDNDPMFELFEDVFSSAALEHQPIYDPAAVRALVTTMRASAPEDRFATETVLHRVLSTTLLHERFGIAR